MPRITVAFLVAALLAGCSAPRPPATAHSGQIAQPVQAPDPCAKYDNPTDFGRCRLFTSADDGRFVPEIGRNADLEKQIRCAPVASDLDVYADCIRRVTGSLAVVTPDAEAVEPAAAPARRAPIQAEPIGPDVAADEFEQLLREVEKLDVALRAPPRVEPTAPAARTIPKAPTVAQPEQSTSGSPLCAENGSCYRDISSYTGRPKTVHVRGYYRKDGTYVRGHYRSRPRR